MVFQSLSTIPGLNGLISGSHNVSGEKPPSSVRLPAPKSPARDSTKTLGAEVGDFPGEAPSPPEGSYGGYHLSYEVKKLM